ncbi:MAG TPA: acyl-CoA dehydrogenase family protein [Saprospiraceae bacterium]|nr:acyl-CoA dehydrogenase family protein [Saprospiraceae bacterium]
MFFELSEEHLAVQAAARDFAQNVLKPGVIERDSKMQYPYEEIRQMGELGFLGMMVSPQYGGGGMDTLSYVLAMEEISKVDNSCSVIMSVNNSLVCWGIETFGTEEQKAKYLPLLAAGQWIGAFCLSEPEAGSDATSQRTTAVDMGDHYRGTKSQIPAPARCGPMDRRFLPQRTRSRQRCHQSAHHRCGYGRPLPVERHQKLDHQWRQLQTAHRNSPNAP